MVRALRVLLTLSVFACAFVACEDDESLRSTASIELEISPASFSFPAVEVGETLQSTVQIRNIGTGELRLIDFDATFNVPADYTLVWFRGEDAPAQGEPGWLAGIDPIDGNSFPQVVAIAPGEIMTDILSPGSEEAILPQIPLGRFGTPDEVAETIFFLCSEAAQYLNGSEIHINGGQHV